MILARISKNSKQFELNVFLTYNPDDRRKHMFKPEYKLLAIDLDGTLLNDDKQISDEDAEAIIRARKSGLKVVIATGRPTSGTRKSLETIGFDRGDFVISNNGATIVDLPDLGNRRTLSITVQDHRRIDAFCRENGIRHYSFDATYCLSDSLHEFTEWEQNANEIEVKIVDFASLDENHRLLKVMAFGEPEMIDRAEAAVTGDLRRRYAVIRSADILLEFLHPKATKGNAVKTVADWLGIKRSQVICIGDSGNDIDMLSYAGLGIAMGNAKPEVIAAADDVTAGNQESGIARALEKHYFR
jgi:Cof subfamily protein (haloacid dehalogenase superfamily)